MQYRKDKYGRDLSVLGFGCMRFTRKGAGIDLAKMEQELVRAIEGGVNYLDTAYIYPGSEAALGKILTKTGLRDQVYIATKLPHYLMKSVQEAEKLFSEQLRRLQTDHVDYYLMHMLTDDATWERMVELGIDKWLREKQRLGQIGQVGFSYHGNSDTFMRLLDAWDWDFCQIQYNYLDEHSQAGRTGLTYAADKGIPVIIMEPLRGGRMTNLPKAAQREVEALGITPAALGFRWLFHQPEVTVVLSGMNSLEMVEENLTTAEKTLPGSVSQAEAETVERVRKEIWAHTKVGCTGCRYCMPCPFGVDIPGTFHAYNTKASEGWFLGTKQYIMCTVLRKNPSNASLCKKCGKCEQHCPQGIPIRKKLQEAAKDLEGPAFQLARFANKTLKLWK